jgi:hypothetical protein
MWRDVSCMSTTALGPTSRRNIKVCERICVLSSKRAKQGGRILACDDVYTYTRFLQVWFN